MGTVSQLHQQYAHILTGRHHQLAEAFSLIGLFGLSLQTCQLGNAIDKLGNRPAKPRINIGQRDITIFHRVMQ